MAISTYDELQDAIKQYTRRTTSTDSDFVTNVPNFIAIAESWINRNLRIRAMETLAALTVTADVNTVALPTGCRRMRRLYFVNSPNSPLRYYAPEEFYTKYAASRSGTPIDYTIEGENLVLGPTPSVSGTIRALYYKALTALSSVSTNTVLTSYPDVYLMPSLAEAHGYLRSFDLKKQYYAQAAEIIAELMRQDEADRHSGSVMQIRGRSGIQ